MDAKFCSRCGSPIVPGTDRCPNCGSFYDERMNYTTNNNQQYYNNQPPPPPGKKTNTVAVFVIVFVVFLFFIVLPAAAILIPAFIGFTEKAKEHQAELSSEYSYNYDYEYNDNEFNIIVDDEKIITQTFINDPGLGQGSFIGTYTDNDGKYDRYIDSEKIYDIYTDSDTGNIIKIRLSFEESLSSWIKEEDTYDSILHNYIACALTECCNYSWGDAQDYLDTFSLSNGMDITDENGYSFYLDVDSQEISFTITVSE